MGRCILQKGALIARVNRTQKKGQGAKVWDVAFYKRALSLLLGSCWYVSLQILVGY